MLFSMDCYDLWLCWKKFLKVFFVIGVVVGVVWIVIESVYVLMMF